MYWQVHQQVSSTPWLHGQLQCLEVQDEQMVRAAHDNQRGWMLQVGLGQCMDGYALLKDKWEEN